MKVVIADDEALARERLRRLLGELGCELVGEAKEGAALLELVETHQPDVALLDIHMPGMDGLQVARALAEMPLPPAVIFTTAHSQHALSAVNTAASAYLLKPIRREDLAQALQKASQPRRAQLGKLLNTNTAEKQIKLPISSGRSQERISSNEIICCLADQKLTRVVHTGGEGLSDEALNQLESKLGGAFLRVHRAALVARQHIHRLEVSEEGAFLHLQGYNQAVPVSRRQLAAVRRLLREAD
ncbi:MAG: LytTR family DNA-binding domain-containing protein [Salinisphaeraceae bacterium]|nr:LytTR family DNA-binding domain-containing protein [Salinisphaeraceae bacterium]